MVVCSVPGCKNTSLTTSNVFFFKFPEDQTYRNKWINFCKWRHSVNLETARICSEHFQESCFRDQDIVTPERFGQRKISTVKELIYDAVPTIKLPNFQDDPYSTSSPRRSTHNYYCPTLPEPLENFEARTNDAERVLATIQSRIVGLEKDQHFLKENVLALERLNSRTEFEISCLRNRMGC